MRVLFVCTGNLCRSPMAEALFRHHTAVEGLPAVVRSAGFLEEGALAEPEAVAAMARRGIDLTGHRSRLVGSTALAGADLVLTMERAHVRAAVARRSEAFGRVFTLRDLLRRADLRGLPAPNDTMATWLGRLHAGRSLRSQFGDDALEDVPDPLGRGTEAFEATATLLDGLVRRLIGVLAGERRPVGDVVHA